VRLVNYILKIFFIDEAMSDKNRRSKRNRKKAVLHISQKNPGAAL